MVKHTWDPTAPDAQGQHVGQDDTDNEGPEGSAAPGGAQDGERIAKALARAGVASRRDIERYIEEGRVAINGRILTSPAVKVGPGDILTVDGAMVSDAEATRLWRYHKPVGLVTTHKDPNGRPTVFDALPDALPRVISIGRLDINSEGLLLLTNDGALARALELPSSGWMRRYRARAHGRTDQATLDRLKAGLTIEGVRYGPIEARLDKAKESRDGTSPANAWITVTLSEGKNREVRRVLEHLGLKVNRLIRLSYGPFQLGVLGAGMVEEIGPRVIREQLAGLIAPENMPTGDKVVAIHQPGLKGRRAPGQGVAADVLLPPPAPPKPKRKAGWAKPKPKALFKGKARAGGKERTVIGPKSSIEAPSTKARPSTRPERAPKGPPGKGGPPKGPPSKGPPPKGGSAKPGPKPLSGRPAEAGPRGQGARPARPAPRKSR
jgi:23S rRNA pseudouridine2605 synthase